MWIIRRQTSRFSLMSEEDIPRGDSDIPSEEDSFVPSESDLFPTPESAGVTSESAISSLRRECLEGRDSLYIFASVVLGYADLNERVHLPMCRFIVQTRRPGGRRAMHMPRVHFKTTVWTIADAMQRVCIDPNIQILLVSDTAFNASRFMKEIQNHFMRNALFRRVFHDIIPANFNKVTWNQYEMEAKRTSISRDPTIDAIGAMGGAESRHYHVIKADDIVTEKAIRSDLEMQKLTEWAGGLESLLVSEKEGEIDLIGSRKKKGDTYEFLEDYFAKDAVEEPLGPFATKRGRLVIFSRGARDEGGDPIFPEKVTREHLDSMQRYFPERYHAQMANSPKSTGVNTFDFDSLRYFQWTENGNIRCVYKGEILQEVSPWDLERIVVYDPSVAEKQKSSKNAIHVLAKGSGPFRFVLESRVEHIPPNEVVEYLFEMDKKWHPSFFSIEKRGLQGWVKYHLNDMAEQKGLPYLQIMEWPPKGDPSGQWAKTEHIRGLQPVVRSNNLWVHETQRDLLEEIEFYPNVRWDDGLDALSQGLTYWPLMLDELELKGRKKREKDFLDNQLLGLLTGGVEEPEPWSEERFLQSFDATGYSARSPRWH
jgi:hypothetical protein